MESLKGGCSSYILSEVIPVLDCVGWKKRKISCSQHDRRAGGMGMMGSSRSV